MWMCHEVKYLRNLSHTLVLGGMTLILRVFSEDIKVFLWQKFYYSNQVKFVNVSDYREKCVGLLNLEIGEQKTWNTDLKSIKMGLLLSLSKCRYQMVDFS